MNILAIGNSFSEDATRYLHGIARARGETLYVANLYIGGCSFEKHFRNFHSEGRVYELQVNGVKTGFYVSLKEALLNRAWDCVTLQQQSAASTCFDSFMPYLAELSSYIRRYVPRAKQILFQTWAYERDSEKLLKLNGYTEPRQMLEDIKASYAMAQGEIGADGIIRGGELFDAMLSSGIDRIHRDTFHATRGLGRYALALLWYASLTGNSVAGDAFDDLDEPITEKEREIAIACVSSLVS